MKDDLFQKKCQFFCSVNEEGRYPKSNLPEIAFLGRSNVGKSSLIKALINKKKIMRISKTPGSTIQINYFNLGNKLFLVDLPGYGYAKQAKLVVKYCSDLIKDYLKYKYNLQLLILVLDPRRNINNNEVLLLKFLKEIEINTLVVFNKIDKVKKDNLKKLEYIIHDMLQNFSFIKDTVSVSCTKGFNINLLKEKIIKNINL